MEPLFFELNQILKQQRETVKQLLTQSQAQNQALRKNDVELLNNAVQQLTKLSRLMAEQDKTRQGILDKLAQGLSISDLLPGAPASLKIELQKLHSEIKMDLQQLHELTALNKLLTRRALIVNQSLLNIFRGGGGQTYQPGAKLKHDQKSLGVLNKTV